MMQWNEWFDEVNEDNEGNKGSEKGNKVSEWNEVHEGDAMNGINATKWHDHEEDEWIVKLINSLASDHLQQPNVVLLLLILCRNLSLDLEFGANLIQITKLTKA